MSIRGSLQRNYAAQRSAKVADPTFKLDMDEVMGLARLARDNGESVETLEARIAAAAAQEPKPDADDDPGTAKAKVTSALDVLGQYFPAEIMAFYITGLAIFNGLGQTDGAVFWPYLFVACHLLIWLYVFVDYKVEKRAEDAAAAAREKAGKSATPSVLTFPMWPFFSSVIAFWAWAAATPGDPIVTSPAATAIAAVVAIFVSLLLPQLEVLWGPSRKVEPEPDNAD